MAIRKSIQGDRAPDVPAVVTGFVVAIESGEVRVDVQGVIGAIRARADGGTNLAEELRLWQEVNLMPVPVAAGRPEFVLCGAVHVPAVPREPAHWPAARVDVASVERIEEGRVIVRTPRAEGPILDADCDLQAVAEWAAPGDVIRVRALEGRSDPAFSLRNVGQFPWPRIERAYSIGSVVRGRVYRVEANYILVDLLPGASVLAPSGELDGDAGLDARDLYRVGECVHGVLLELSVDLRRGVLSIRQAHGREPLPPLVCNPGQPPFLADERPRPRDVAPAASSVAEPGSEDVVKQLLRQAQGQLMEMRKRLRSAVDRARPLEAHAAADLDPLADAQAFLCAVRVEYARRFDEENRTRYPLQPMRVGPTFLESVRALEGVASSQVVEVCAQVASLRAHEVPAREVQPLSSGAAGSPALARASDGARAWRCSLEDGSASACRLHWWDLPGPAGRTIEFASVGEHDELAMPE